MGGALVVFPTSVSIVALSAVLMVVVYIRVY